MRTFTKKYLGAAAVLLSAVLFGIGPSLIKLTFDMGSNGINATFLRSALILPVLLVLLRVKKVPLRLTAEEGKGVLLGVGIGIAATSVLLGISYAYIPVSVATPLHFIYPVMVAVIGRIFYRERLSGLKLLALLLCAAGVALFFERGAPLNAFGVAIALISGCTYAFYIQYLDKSRLRHMDTFKLLFYINAVTAVSAGVMGLFTGSLSFGLTPMGWLYMLLVAVGVSLFAFWLFAAGLKLVGGFTAAILSTLEPLGSIVCGILLLGEVLTPARAWGCAAILASVIFVTLLQAQADKKENRQATPAGQATLKPPEGMEDDLFVQLEASNPSFCSDTRGAK